MAFLVEQTKEEPDNREPERIDIELLAIGKRTGLSFEEINQFRVRDLLDYVRAYTGAEDDKPRMATQSDIDAFFSN